MNTRDLPCPIGEVFGKLTVIKEVEPQFRGKVRNRRFRRIVVKCSCGSQLKEVDLKDVRNNQTTSCGCARWEKIIKHNESGDPLYKHHTNMKMRSKLRKTKGDDCNIYPPWLQKEGKGYLLFKEWSMKNGYIPNTTCLCRNGDKGDYTPDNCRWGTHQENSEESNAKYSLVKRVKEKEWKKIYNLAKFCRDNNLLAGSMNNVKSGLCTSHRGWDCKPIQVT